RRGAWNGEQSGDHALRRADFGARPADHGDDHPSDHEVAAGTWRDEPRGVPRHSVRLPNGQPGRAPARPTDCLLRVAGTDDGERGLVYSRLPRRRLTMKRSSFITWEQLKVGVVILGAIGVLMVAIYKLGQAANLFARRYELLVLLPNASGLRAGGAVFVAGQ